MGVCAQTCLDDVNHHGLGHRDIQMYLIPMLVRDLSSSVMTNDIPGPSFTTVDLYDEMTNDELDLDWENCELIHMLFF